MERSETRAAKSGMEALSRLTGEDRKSTRLNSSHLVISYAVFCLKKKKQKHPADDPPVHCLGCLALGSDTAADLAPALPPDGAARDRAGEHCYLHHRPPVAAAAHI